MIRISVRPSETLTAGYTVRTRELFSRRDARKLRNAWAPRRWLPLTPLGRAVAWSWAAAFVVAVLAALVLAGCGGGGGGGDSAPAVSPAQIASVTIDGVEAAPRFSVCIGRAYAVKVSLLNLSRNADTLTFEETAASGARTGGSWDLPPDTAWYQIPMAPQGPAGAYREILTVWSTDGTGRSYSFELLIRACP